MIYNQLNVAITGHTKGIGLGLAIEFANRGSNVFGFSRSNGYDITTQSSTNDIMSEVIANKCEVLILNAQYEFQQVYQLYAIYELWKTDPTKTVVVLGSMAADKVDSYFHPYSVHKNALDRAVEQLHTNCKCRIINIKPGYTDTPAIQHLKMKKMPVSQIVNTIFWTLDQPDDVIIRSVVLSPRLN